MFKADRSLGLRAARYKEVVICIAQPERRLAGSALIKALLAGTDRIDVGWRLSLAPESSSNVPS